MTIEQAIRILDPETSAAALGEIEYYGVSSRPREDQACRMAVEIDAAASRGERTKKYLTNRNFADIL